jgi:hypothetical protein
MIRIKFQGRLGNQLFQYAFAKIASKEINSFYLIGINFKWGWELKYFRLSFPYNLIKYNFFSRIYNYLQNKIVFKDAIIENVNLLDWRTIKLKDRTDYMGYFQTSTLYSLNKSLLLEEFKIKKKYKNLFFNKYKSILKNEIIVISCRVADDYKEFKFPLDDNYGVALPFEWYIKVLKTIDLKNKKILVIGDDMTKVIELFSIYKYDFTFISDNVINQFQLLNYADTCIIANSSFAWWGAFLNIKPNKKVYAPKNWGGYNAGIEYPPNIMLKDFIWVD